MRLFVAANLPEDVKSALSDNMEDCRASGVEGRFTRPCDLHVTLAYMGDVAKVDVPGIKAALHYAVEDIPAFEIALDDYGTFPPTDPNGASINSADGKTPRKTVLWQGFENTFAFERLAEAVRRELSGVGVSFDEKPFVAHATLARNAHLPACGLKEPWVGSGLVESITLFRSRTSSDGTVYEPLYTADLRPAFVHPKGRTIIVDADACPVIPETLRVARKRRTPVLLVANGTQNLAHHLRRGDPQTPRDGYWVATMNVMGGADSADFQIATLVQPGDVVVTQDFGVAAMALGADALALGVRGREYTRETIDSMMLIRHEEKKVRRAGGKTKGQSPFSEEDATRFTTKLTELLTR